MSNKKNRPGDPAACTDGFSIAGQKVGVQRNKDQTKGKKNTAAASNAQTSPVASKLQATRLKIF